MDSSISSTDSVESKKKLPHDDDFNEWTKCLKFHDNFLTTIEVLLWSLTDNISMARSMNYR